MEKTVEIEFLDGTTKEITVRRLSSREKAPINKLMAPKEIQEGVAPKTTWDNFETYKKQYCVACMVKPEELKTLEGLETLLHDAAINKILTTVQEVNGEIGIEKAEKKSEPPSSVV